MRGHLLHAFQLEFASYTASANDNSKSCGFRENLLEELDPFSRELVAEARKPGDVPSWPRQANDKPLRNWIRNLHHYNGNGVRCVLSGQSRGWGLRHNHVRLQTHEFRCQLSKPSCSFTLCITVLNREILPFNPIELNHVFSEGIQ